MSQTINLQRRRFLQHSALIACGIGLSGTAIPVIAQSTSSHIRIAFNPGVENSTLTTLMSQQGFFRQYDADVTFIPASGTSGPFKAITSGAADLCMTSGYNGLLSQIARGAKVKIVGAGMKKTALAIYAAQDRIETLQDLKGKIVAVGSSMGLLHMLMLELLKEKDIDASQINFVNKGSNEACYKAVIQGEADACCSSVSHLNNKDGLAVIQEGNLWQSLPDYIFQTAYASDAALKNKHNSIVAVMAAYGSLYNYLMSPDAHDAFFSARKHAEKIFNPESAQADWDFIQMQKPYSSDLSLTENDISYQQQISLQLGNLKQKQPFSIIADMSAAADAAKLVKTGSLANHAIS
ncbi:ABC transporter substrate-binding protein [Pantoea cypripedii]|uniref:Nitrate ABC transporter substrate-binding protein n=1 Tax=Pantoea cypripedii TaxID=55209 RepID=A0A6B9GB43_PANCY|nr:ABC transporter substrate-binding protein [Pantoea cypripedii]QGY33093.1 nitrate ABC transporter substrate-binding protein [Pantoea cypripedii]